MQSCAVLGVYSIIINIIIIVSVGLGFVFSFLHFLCCWLIKGNTEIYDEQNIHKYKGENTQLTH